MASVKIISLFESMHSESNEFKWTNPTTQKEVVFPARPAGMYPAALVEINDGTGTRAQIELPKVVGKIEVGDVLHIDCPQISELEKPLRVRDVTRHTKATK